jgi:hypothetical protein
LDIIINIDRISSSCGKRIGKSQSKDSFPMENEKIKKFSESDFFFLYILKITIIIFKTSLNAVLLLK